MDVFPRLVRPVRTPLGLYFRPTRNDHGVFLQLLAEKSIAISGIVFDASLNDRQAELRQEIQRQGFETVLDPRTIELGTPFGFTPKLAAMLPWGQTEYYHTPESLKGSAGKNRVAALAKHLMDNEYKAVLAPAHYVASSSDPWIPVDTNLTLLLRDALDSLQRTETLIYYPLAISDAVLRSSEHWSRILLGLQGLPIDAIWLRIHPFGTARSGPIALRSYIEACQRLHSLGLPVVADRTGTLGVALLAFGAASGVESGVTAGETFDVSRLMRPRVEGKPFLVPPRVYLQDLGAFLTRSQAMSFFENRQMKARFGCRDSTCCRRGARDTVSDPRRHFVLSRIREVGKLSRVPPPLRAGMYLDEFLRPATDLARLATQVEPSLESSRRRLESWRLTLASIDREGTARSFAVPPEGRRIQHRRGA